MGPDVRFRGLLFTTPLLLIALLALIARFESPGRPRSAFAVALGMLALGSLGAALFAEPWRADGWDLGLLWPAAMPMFVLVAALLQRTLFERSNRVLRYPVLAATAFCALVGLFETGRELILLHLGRGRLDLPLRLIESDAPDAIRGMGLKGLVLILAGNLEGALLAVLPLILAVALIFVTARIADQLFAPQFDIENYVRSRAQE